MAYLVGILLALSVGIFAQLTQFDRERGFYPTILIVIASYYDLFAVMASNSLAVVNEALALAAFTTIAVIGFRKNLLIVAIALCGHGLFDAFHHHIISNPGVPLWWPSFCIGFDLTAATYLAVSLMINKPTQGSEI